GCGAGPAPPGPGAVESAVPQAVRDGAGRAPAGDDGVRPGAGPAEGFRRRHPAGRRGHAGEPQGVRRAAAGRDRAGRYLQIRLLVLIACGTRALIDAVWATVSTGEPRLLDKLVYRGNFRPGMLVLADRYFSGHPQVARIAATGADLIVRVQYRRRLPVLRELPDGSYISVL